MPLKGFNGWKFQTLAHRPDLNGHLQGLYDKCASDSVWNEPCPVSHCECQIDATRLHRCTAKIKSTFFTTACLPGQKKSSAARRSFGFAESCIAKINLHHLRPRVHKRARVWETSQTTEVCSSQVFAPHSRASSTTSELSNLLGWHLSAYLPALRQAQSATCQDTTRNLRKFNETPSCTISQFLLILAWRQTELM